MKKYLRSQRSDQKNIVTETLATLKLTTCEYLRIPQIYCHHTKVPYEQHHKNTFKHKHGAAWYAHIKVGRNETHCTNNPLDGKNKCTASDICKMIEFLVDNIYMLGLVDSFSNRRLAFLWEITVPHY